MKLKKLTTALILAALPTAGAFAAALDRSGQSVAAFLQPGNYFEAGISVLDPDVAGTTNAALGSQNTGDMAGDYYFPHAALKLQLNDKFSFGLIYDQPFGADAEYTQSVAFTHPTQGNTSVEVDTQNLAMIFGFQPTEIGTYMQAQFIKPSKAMFLYAAQHTAYMADMLQQDLFLEQRLQLL